MARFLCLFLFALTGRRRSRDPGRVNLISNASLPGGILLPVFASRVIRIKYRTGSQITIVRWTLLPEELRFRMKFPCRSWYSIDRDAFTSMKILQNVEKAFISWSSVLKMGDEFSFFFFFFFFFWCFKLKTPERSSVIAFSLQLIPRLMRRHKQRCILELSSYFPLTFFPFLFFPLFHVYSTPLTLPTHFLSFFFLSLFNFFYSPLPNKPAESNTLYFED